MDRLLDKKKVAAYFREIAEKNTDISHYIGSNKQELTDLMDSRDGFAGPVLSFYGYRWKLEGTDQRTFNTRVISFAILIGGVPIDDYEAQDEAIAEAEAIGLEVLSYIYQESLMPGKGWLYNNVNKSTVVGSEIILRDTGGLFGMDFSFELKVADPLVVDKEKWSDGDKFC